MAASKTPASLIAAGTTATTTSSAVNLSTAYGANVNFTVANGAAGPTTQATFQVQISNNWNGGSPTNWTNLGGPMTPGTAASASISNSIDIPEDAQAVQVIYTASSGGTAATCVADISYTTSI